MNILNRLVNYFKRFKVNIQENAFCPMQTDACNMDIQQRTVSFDDVWTDVEKLLSALLTGHSIPKAVWNQRVLYPFHSSLHRYLVVNFLAVALQGREVKGTLPACLLVLSQFLRCDPYGLYAGPIWVQY